MSNEVPHMHFMGQSLCLQEPPRYDSLMELSVLETLVYAALSTQSWDNAAALPRPAVLFRNQWPPNFAQPGPDTLYIHQLAFEFQGIPSAWVHPLNNLTQEVWVPSEYNAQAFADSGVLRSKIAVLKHGIEFGKFNMSLPPLPLPTMKGFKFLFNGGLLPRKGIDILLAAYSGAFKPSDNVSLVIHSAYGDNFQLQEIQAMQKNPRMPEVLLIQDDLPHFNLVQLYKAANVYVSPYRSEGFGLTILEAMAAGLQVIVTDFGPSTEICPADVGGCLLVDTDPAKCMMKPCGKMSLFDQPTVKQPAWSEPSVNSLKRHMQETFYRWESDGESSRTFKESIAMHAKHNSWYNLGSEMIGRIAALIEMDLNVQVRSERLA